MVRKKQTERQIARIPADQSALYDQMSTTLQASRLLEYHMQMQMQEMFNLYEFFDRSPSEVEPEEKLIVFGFRFQK